MGKTFKEQFVEALENGITHKAMYLLQFMKNEINKPYYYRSPLVWAKRYGNEKVIKALSDMEALEVVDKEGMGKELLKILDADKIDEKRAIELIKDGANIEKKDEDGYTALIKASQRGRVEIVKALIESGAKVNEKDNYDNTALMSAECTEIVKLLLDNGAKVDEKNNNGETALKRASLRGNVEVVKALLDAGAKVDEKDNKEGDTALIWASLRGDVEVVKSLIDAGAKVDEKNNDGKTALIKASLFGHVEVVEALLDAGADVTITNNGGKTAIYYADNDEIKKLLKEAMEKQKMMNVKNKTSDFFWRE